MERFHQSWLLEKEKSFTELSNTTQPLNLLFCDGVNGQKSKKFLLSHSTDAQYEPLCPPVKSHPAALKMSAKLVKQLGAHL